MVVVPELLNQDQVFHVASVPGMRLVPSLLCSWTDECPGLSQSNLGPWLYEKARINNENIIGSNNYLVLTLTVFQTSYMATSSQNKYAKLNFIEGVPSVRN